MKTVLWILWIILYIYCHPIYAQQQAEMTITPAVENKELQTLLMFQEITFDRLLFRGDVKGKQYELRVREFVNGAYVRTETLFDGAESDYFTLKDD